MTLEIETIGDGPLIFMLMLKSCGVGGGCTLDYNVSSGPSLSFDIEIGDGPGPELDNSIILCKIVQYQEEILLEQVEWTSSACQQYLEAN